MDTLKATDLKHASGALKSWKNAAFSLVEVTLALGIMAFSFTSIIGLLPLGLTVFRQAIDVSVSSQIVQRVANDAQQTDFSLLIGDVSGTPLVGTDGTKATRYFDEQGSEIVPATPGANLTSEQKKRVIYWVNTRIRPATTLVGNANANARLATVTVQIANNPANQTPNMDTSTKLWKESNFPVTTYSVLVSGK